MKCARSLESFAVLNHGLNTFYFLLVNIVNIVFQKRYYPLRIRATLFAHADGTSPERWQLSVNSSYVLSATMLLAH